MTGLHGGQALGLVMGAEGGAARGILLDEASKGADAAWRLAWDDSFDSVRSAVRATIDVSLYMLPALMHSIACTNVANDLWYTTFYRAHIPRYILVPN